MDNQPPKPADSLPEKLVEAVHAVNAAGGIDTNTRTESAETRPQYDQGAVPLWIAIRNRRLDYNAFARFVTRAMCGDQPVPPPSQSPFPPPHPAKEYLTAAMGTLRQDAVPSPGQTPPLHECTLGWLGHGMNAYELLKTASEIFLILECGVFISRYFDPVPSNPTQNTVALPGADDRVLGLSGTLEQQQGQLIQALGSYLQGGTRLPYIQRVVESTYGSEPMLYHASPFCGGVLTGRVDCPCFLELIWSYWHEEGMLVQGLNALSMRFQNRRIADGRDPLAQLELSPLRPLSSIFWGYVQDEQHRLSLARRNYEYEHEYGLSLRGKAVPTTRTADRRSKFIDAFHDLLFRCAQYFQQCANLQFKPDPFPLLNGLKEVHLILAQGAGNQFGDLPWTARVEMLMQQWILARPEIGEFLGRRPMVTYAENWMANADTLKTLMGWSDTSIVHFRNLAVFGEQLLLSIRWHAWSAENDSMAAHWWANYFRPEIQGYMHAYRVATGVDLTVEPKDSAAADLRKESPSALLERRLGEQRRSNGAR